MDSIELLQHNFGWSEFKPGQQQIVDQLLSGQSALAVFPTGGGKSLCYQLPALAFDGLTVVVSPLIALMKDQIDQLADRGIQARRLDSSLTFDQYKETMESVRSGTAKMLYVAPERFFNERFRSSLEGIKISLFAIDEAHCISQWGHNFRPDYLKLARISQQLNVERVLALTATATPAVRTDIVNAFSLRPESVVCTEFFRPNLHLGAAYVSGSQRDEQLVAKLNERQPGPTIVYVTLQKTAVEVAEMLQDHGFEAKAYHAGFKPDQRNQVQEWFMKSDSGIVVATIAFGMGIDKSDIRYVYHYNPPKSLENYAQEIGRAGRDGLESRCDLFVVPEDRIVLENFIYGDTPTLAAMKQLVETLNQQADHFYISLYGLSSDCDMKRIVVQTLMTYFELDGYLEGTSPRYNIYRFKPNVPSATIVDAFNGERREFVRSLIACSRKSKTWFDIDIEAAQQQLNSDRSRIVKALDFFGEQGWIQLETKGLVHGYRRLKPIPIDLADDYFARARAREKDQVQRIHQILKLAESETCLAATISEHFGQTLEQPCGVCSACSEATSEMPMVPEIVVDGAAMAEVEKVFQQYREVFTSARLMTRFLCGISSPSLIRARVTKKPEFGSMERFPFGELLDRIEESFFGR